MTASSSPGQVKVTGKFIDGSTATGVLMIFINSEHVARYHVYNRNGDEMKVLSTISGLASGNYTVSVFVVEEGGLPFNRTATIPRTVTVIGEYDLM